MSLREENKKRRRQAILDAAEHLMRRDGSGSFSMRELASEADVSFATPFNLFVSKNGVLSALLYSKLPSQQYLFVDKSSRRDPINELFHLAKGSAEGYISDPKLFRPLVSVIGIVGGAEGQQSFDFGSNMWKSILEEAKEAQFIDSGRDLGVVSRSLHGQFRGALLQWAVDEISSAEFVLEVQYGLSLSLLGIVAPAKVSAVKARRNKLERELKKLVET